MDSYSYFLNVPGSGESFEVLIKKSAFHLQDGRSSSEPATQTKWNLNNIYCFLSTQLCLASLPQPHQTIDQAIRQRRVF